MKPPLQLKAKRAKMGTRHLLKVRKFSGFCSVLSQLKSPSYLIYPSLHSMPFIDIFTVHWLSNPVYCVVTTFEMHSASPVSQYCHGKAWAVWKMIKVSWFSGGVCAPEWVSEEVSISLVLPFMRLSSSVICFAHIMMVLIIVILVLLPCEIGVLPPLVEWTCSIFLPMCCLWNLWCDTKSAIISSCSVCTQFLVIGHTHIALAFKACHQPITIATRYLICIYDRYYLLMRPSNFIYLTSAMSLMEVVLSRAS